MMVLIVVSFIIKVLFVHFSVCTVIDDDPASCEDRFYKILNRTQLRADSNMLYLLQGPDDSRTRSLNENFINISHQLGFKVTYVEPFCPDDDVRATEIAAEHLRNVINLRVTNSYYSDEDIQKKNLSYAGYSGQFDAEVAVCSKNLSSGLKNTDDNYYTYIKYDDSNDDHNIETNDPKENSEACDIIRMEKLSAVKLISNSVKDYAVLYDMIKVISSDYDPRAMPYWEKLVKTSTHTKGPMTQLSVLICLNGVKIREDAQQAISERFSKLSIRFVDHCERIDDYSEHKLLAALLPKPLELEDRTLIPVIFYDTSYLQPEDKDTYPNSMTIYQRPIKVLKYALLKYIQMRDFNRVAIISDDLPESEEFEMELTTLFQQKGILYGVQPCMKRICNFTEALTTLRNANAKVIIANVGEKYAFKLAKTADRTEVTSQQGFMWIWRTWPFKTGASRSMGDVFSIDLSPDGSAESLGIQNIKHRVEKGIIIVNKTKDALALESELGNNTRKFYAKVSKFIQKIRNSMKVTVNLRKISDTGHAKHICSLSINTFHARFNEDNFVISNCNLETGLPMDMDSCTLWSFNFYSPCEDFYVLLEMIIIFGFVVAVLGIYMIFYKYSRIRHHNYTNL